MSLLALQQGGWSERVYATSNYTYNARDQLTQISQAQQTRSLEYDGHGRLWRRTTPEQGQTTFSYYANDRLQTITDARGATQTFAYNGRHLATGISFGVPAGVAATPNVTFSYDAAGNRTGMSDGHGSVSYSYDTLSRLTQETRYFSALNNSFALTYAYNLAGQLTQIGLPWNSVTVGYTRDQTGQITAVTGANYYGVSTYASGLAYRASGALKWLQYGNGLRLAADYDTRLRLSRWNVTYSNGVSVLGSAYSYHYFSEHSHRVTFAQSLTGGDSTGSGADRTLDRSYDYNQVGRLHVSYTGSEARAHAYTGQWGVQDGPYAQGYLYDVWGNIVERLGWGGENAAYTASYTNNRRAGATYDAAGNITNDGGQAFTYDATGQQAWASHLSTEQGYDGDRLRVRRTENGVTTYYLRSSALGGRPVAEINSSGGWARGYVYLGSQLLALQQGGVEWVHQDPVTKSQRLTDVSGNVTALVELDPWGGETSRSVNSWRQPQRYTTYLRDGNQSDEAMMRRYNRWWSRFDQPDPYDGSYDLSDPQSFNRYAYVQNDPVNFMDPTGLCGFAVIWTQWSDGTITYTTVWSGNCSVNVRGSGGSGGGGGGSLFDGQFVPEEPPPDETGGGGDGGGGGAGPQQTAPTQQQQPTKKACKFTNTRITFYDSPKGNTAIRGTRPIEGITAAADPTLFGYPYPRGGRTPDERRANQRIRAETQARLREADIFFSIPGLGLRRFEDVGGAVEGNRIDIYVERNARAAATRYNRRYGDFVNGVVAIVPIGIPCPPGSQEISAAEAGF